MSYCFLRVGTVGAVRCVRTINSVKVFVEAYVTCNDAYTCAIPCAIVEVVSKNFESLLVVIAKYKIRTLPYIAMPRDQCPSNPYFYSTNPPIYSYAT